MKDSNFLKEHNGRLMWHPMTSPQDSIDNPPKSITSSEGEERLALSHLIPSDDPTYGPKDWQEVCVDHWSDELIVGHEDIRIEL
ncbi:hypothetical protein N8222_08255 [Oceanospirillaceae bacterium]|nr:hypothetical protein [Oceanospirillaceae bacterium]